MFPIFLEVSPESSGLYFTSKNKNNSTIYYLLLLGIELGNLYPHSNPMK